MSKLLYFTDYKTILETNNYCVFIPSIPHVDRADGGHICISIKHDNIFTLQELSMDQLFELSVLTTAVGEAMLTVGKKQGIDIELINYQINGNWAYKQIGGANLHLHLYGRAVSSKKQTFGQCLYFPDKKTDPTFYSNNMPFFDNEIELIRQHIVYVLNTKYKKYSAFVII